MLFLLLFILELTVLFFLSKRLQKNLGTALYHATKSRKMAVYIMAILFLPGTFVHEMAHFLAALFLLVPVGEMELLPKIEEDYVKLGSVGIAKTDPVRRFIIGAAPFLVGTVLILLAVYYLNLNIFENSSQNFGNKEILLTIAAIYLIFTVSNTMFSSKKDMEGLWAFWAILLLSIITIWILGVDIDFSFVMGLGVSEFFGSAAIFLLVPLLLDIIAVLALKRRT